MTEVKIIFYIGAVEVFILNDNFLHFAAIAKFLSDQLGRYVTMRCPFTRSAGNVLSVVSWVMGTANRAKGRAVVILSVDATHLLMASEDSDVVGMKAVPQTPQGPRAMYGYITPTFSGCP